jgi:DUF971 family protein
MSHEGIRIVSEQQARRESAAEARLPIEQATPAKVRVKKTEGTGMEIDWKDGHASAWNFAWLRNACPCATCNEERQKAGREPGIPKPKAGGLLVMYEAPPRPVEITPVGKYAIRFKWNDGHESGIYSWDYLRRMCLCDACLQARERTA